MILTSPRNTFFPAIVAATLLMASIYTRIGAADETAVTQISHASEICAPHGFRNRPEINLYNSQRPTRQRFTDLHDFSHKPADFIDHRRNIW
jgi:hypothetical protein